MASRLGDEAGLSLEPAAIATAVVGRLNASGTGGFDAGHGVSPVWPRPPRWQRAMWTGGPESGAIEDAPDGH